MLTMPKNLIFQGAFLQIVKFFMQFARLMTRMIYHMMLRLNFLSRILFHTIISSHDLTSRFG